MRHSLLACESAKPVTRWQCLPVAFQHLPPPRIQFVQLLQLHAETGSLHLVHTTVAAPGDDRMVAGLPAILMQEAELRGQTRIVGDHGTGIAQGPQVLGGIEAEAGEVPLSPGLAATGLGAGSVGVIFVYGNIWTPPRIERRTDTGDIR